MDPLLPSLSFMIVNLIVLASFVAHHIVMNRR